MNWKGFCVGTLPTYFALCILSLSILYLDSAFGDILVSDDNLGCVLKRAVDKSSPPIQEDLLSILRDNNLYGTKYSTNGATKNYKYDFDLCGDVKVGKPKASLIRTNKIQGDVVAIGLRNSTTIRGKKGEWILIDFGPGENESESNACMNNTLSSSVMIYCDRDYSTGKLELIYEDVQYCKFLFELRVAGICGPAPGMSGWGILFLMLFIALVIYFIIGVLYQRFQKGAKGVEQIPNRLFWFGLGNKIADCFSVICRCDKYCSPSLDQLDDHQSPYSGAYSPIGEGTQALPGSRSIDKDTALLNP